MDKLSHVLRREQTLRELRKLKAEMSAWLQQQDDQDRDEAGNYLGRHKSRIQGLRGVLCGAAGALEEGISQINVMDSRLTGEVMKDCREYDQSIVWLRRVFTFYEEKFNQRVDKVLAGPLLEAADEVIWSCYRHVYRSLPVGQAPSQKPPPLAYLAPEYSPAAWNPDKEGAGSLISGGLVDGLDEFIHQMPVSLLRLPPWCLGAPWWLVYIGHEVGHHIQYNLGLVKAFKEGVRGAALKNGLPGGYLDLWGAWSEEVFADLFSVMLMGSAAADALVEAEWSSDADMLLRRKLYPPAAARLWLLDGAARRLGLPGLKAAGELRLDEMLSAGPEAEKNKAVLQDVVEMGFGDWTPSLGGMQQWCGAQVIQSAYQKGLVNQWSQALPKQSYQPGREASLPRILAVSAYYAFKALPAGKDEAGRSQALEKLSQNVIATIRSSGPVDETRAGVVEDHEAGDLGNKLSDLLTKASRQRESIGISGG